MTTLYRETVSTPIGKLLLVATDRGLCAVEYTSTKRERILSTRIARYFSPAVLTDHANDHITAAREWIDKYFRGEFRTLSKLRFDQRGSDFELKVWRRMARIPLGRKASYADLARAVGSPKAARAVGNASRSNPLSLVIPCHRVVGTSGDLTGYGGGLDRKSWLLDHESATPATRPNQAEMH